MDEQIALELSRWYWFNHLLVWGSCLMWFIICGLYSFVGGTFNGFMGTVTDTAAFWLGVFFILMVGMGRDVFYKAYIHHFRPDFLCVFI